MQLVTCLYPIPIGHQMHSFGTFLAHQEGAKVALIEWISKSARLNPDSAFLGIQPIDFLQILVVDGASESVL